LLKGFPTHRTVSRVRIHSGSRRRHQAALVPALALSADRAYLVTDLPCTTGRSMPWGTSSES